MTVKSNMTFALLLCAICSVAQGQSSLQITSPADGTIVVPGQTITISVSADPSISNIAIVGQNPIGFSQTTTSPLQFSLTIPGQIPVDQYELSAVGVDGTGQDVSSSPIHLSVESNFFPFKIRTEPGVLRFRATGERMPLRVVGTAFNGTQGDVTHSTRTRFFSDDPSVASVDNRGIVTAVGPGNTFIRVNSSGASVAVSTKVPKAIQDTTPPVTTAILSQQPNAAGWNNTDVTIHFTSTDSEPGGTGVQSITIIASGAQTTQITVPADHTDYTITVEGTTTVKYFATDNASNSEQPKSLVVKLDKTAPVISGLPSGCVLWPPNEKLNTVATVSASDALSGMASFDVTATSSEPADPNKPDIVVTGAGLNPRTVQLRAERLGQGTGRTYQISTTASDVAGNTVLQTGTCTVPHDQDNH